MKALALAVAGLLSATAAFAEGEATVRVGNHHGFGRVVFEFSASTSYEVAEHGNRLLIVFSGGSAIASPSGVPRNVLSVQGGPGSATMVIAPGAHARPRQMGNRVVVDVLDPVAGERLRPPASALVVPAMQPSAPPVAQPGRIAAPVISDLELQAEPTAAVVLVAEPAPAPLPVPVPPPAPVSPGPLRLAVEAGIGAAAFRRGDMGIVVFDGPVPIDIDRIRNAAQFTAAKVQAGVAATVLQIPLEPGYSLRLVRDPSGWTVLPIENGPLAPAAEQVPGSDGLTLKVDPAGRVVTIQDPETGHVLLVGTGNPSSGAVQRVAMGRRTPEYQLLPTWLGVAVEPLSDRVDLRSAASGFTLVSPGGLPQPMPVNPPNLIQRFDLSQQPAPVLMKRLEAQIAGAAGAPVRGRTPERVAAALTMIALGMGAEAQALLIVTAADDPAAAASAEMAGLSGIAAVLAGRPSEAVGLDDARLDGADDVVLWRGIREAMQDKMAAASPTLSRRLPLIMAYPEALRNRLLPVTAEAIALTDAPIPQDAGPSDGKLLAFARAVQKERRGDVDAALAAYDALVAGPDKADQVRATIRAAELRFSNSKISAGEAADILERQAMAWRGDAREGVTRLRAAELRTKAGAWRPALDWLKQTETLFPDLRTAVRSQKGAVFLAMLSDAAPPIAPLDLVTLAANYADSIPDGAEGAAVAALLADKLVELDLPERAASLLQGLMRATSPGPAQAALGLRLAQLRLEAGDPTGANAALAGFTTADLPAEMTAAQALMRGRIQAAQGNLTAAIGTLTALGTANADELRAKLLEQKADWRGALAALNDLAAKTVPTDGPLSEKQQDIVLRQASAAVQAQDVDAAQAMAQQVSRLTGAREDLFRVLMARPVREATDLPRARTDIALARAIPERLQALTRR